MDDDISDLEGLDDLEPTADISVCVKCNTLHECTRCVKNTHICRNCGRVSHECPVCKAVFESLSGLKRHHTENKKCRKGFAFSTKTLVTNIGQLRNIGNMVKHSRTKSQPLIISEAHIKLL